MSFHPSKFLGQNFLINKGIVDNIIVAAELTAEDTVLEIGPGMGVLTEKLIEHAGRVIAVEKDKRLHEFLLEKFRDNENFELINGDILKITNDELKITNNFKIVANIPYNITGAFFHKFLLADKRPQMIVVMIQKEVGERILGKTDRSILSLVAELYGTCEKICNVSAGSFNPPPKVDSVVMRLIAHSSPLSIETEKKVLHLAKIGFSQKRKKLISNLSTGLKLDKKVLKNIFSTLDLSENARAEELSKDMWLKLAEHI